ncbi:polysaccharide deacetylase family protein [Paenibacillus sp. YAF4_2]|uniref:polysaccharide deacetylase family protein n=1 Tax=Paenibacillus sp. YAF4_2 TaxID=3233085 RepID=UPI003F970B0F
MILRRGEPIYRIDTPQKLIALTFDIGWGDAVADQVLQVLKHYEVMEATFFLSSAWVSKKPATARKIRDRGYEIGSHGHLHENYTEHSNRWIKREVKKADAIINKATGAKCRLIRTPNGDMNNRVTRLLGSLGYQTIHWSVDSLDWTNPGVTRVIRNVTTEAKKGDVVLLHASDSAKQTVEALPVIITRLRQKGFKFVTISRLLRV